MARLGTALGRFHRVHASPLLFDAAGAAARMARYAEAIGTPRGPLSRLPAWLAPLHTRAITGSSALTLKGIDLRNLLIDDRGAVTLLDPGRLKRTHAEADLARFILTYRIAHWGSPWFALVGSPDARAEAAFVRGYAGAAALQPELLRVYLVKEILKHWHTALEVLRLRNQGALASRVTRALYINRFYARQLARELRRPL